MGEEAAKKPKVEGKKKPHWMAKKQEPKRAAFKAPTAGLEDKFFTVGDSRDAANYEEVRKAVANHASLLFKTCGPEAREAIEKGTAHLRQDPPTIADIKARRKWEVEYDSFVKREESWNKEVKKKTFQLLLAHCHPDVREKLESAGGWEAADVAQDPIRLLELIRNVVHKHEEVKQGTMGLVEQYLNYFLTFQKDNEPLTEFVRNKKAQADIIDTYGGECGFHATIFNEHKVALAAELGVATTALTPGQEAACRKASCEEFKAAVVIRLANDKKYGEAKMALDNKYLSEEGEGERAKAPKTIDAAVRYLKNYKPVSKQMRPLVQADIITGVALAQQGRKLECYVCQGNHPYMNCNQATAEQKAAIGEAIKAGGYTGGLVQEGQNHLTIGDSEWQQLSEGVANVNIDEEEASIDISIKSTEAEDEQVEDGGMDGVVLVTPSGNNKRFNCGENLLWLDSAATEHTMFVLTFLVGLFTSSVTLRQNCNAGSKLVNKKGNCLGFEFWYSPGGITNLLSIPQLEEEGHRIRYRTGGRMEVWTTDGRIITFQKSTGACKGMYFIDLSRPQDFIRTAGRNDLFDSFTFVETVRENMEGYTAEQVQQAKLARDAMAMMAHPSMQRMKQLVSRSTIVKNLPFTSNDLTNSEALYGPDRGAIRGKTVRRRPHRVRPDLIRLPQQLYERLKIVTLAADVMFVNGLPFFITKSRGIKLITVQFLPSRTVNKLVDALHSVMRIYRRGGFIVETCLMDMEFTKIVDHVTEAIVNTTAAREHVTDIERDIRTVKERARSTTSELPYKDCMPDIFIIKLVEFVTMWLNAFIALNGASDDYSPREIVTRMTLDFKLHCQARFGAYVEASEDPDITNTNTDRTSPCICLGPTGNVQGSTWCFNLETKKLVTRRTVTPLPMPGRVVRRVRALGLRGKQKRTSQRLQFLDRLMQQFSWDTDDTNDDTAGLIEKEVRDTDALIDEIPGVELEEDHEALTAAVQPTAAPTTAQLAAAALQNANLTNTTNEEIAGVDDDVPNLIQPDSSDDEADNDDEFDGGALDGLEEEVQYIGENLAPPAPQEEIDLLEDSEQEGENNDEDNNIDFGAGTGCVSDHEDQGDTQGTTAGNAAGGQDDQSVESNVAVRVKRRKRKKVRRPTVVDFANRAFDVQDGVLHINPNVLKQAREDTKISSELTESKGMVKKEETVRVANGNARTAHQKYVYDKTRVNVMAPRTAGISGAALATLVMPPPVLKEGEHLTTDAVVLHIVGVVLAQQYSVNKGIQLFGDRARESVKKELQQLHDYVTYTPVHAHELTAEQRKEALASLIFITEKRCGRVKSRACVNGNPQREYIPKETAASPTVMNDSVMITSAIDAHEGRKVVTCDIPGAFLHADLDEEVVMLLRGQLADLMVQIDPELYAPYLIKSKKGESLLYVRMLKAMYGLLRSALLFYLKLVEDLKSYGFEINPYDPCVATKMVDGTQMTVTWHVDDLKISHLKQSRLDEFLHYLRSKYGDGLVVHTGDVHDYLGVDHDYSEKGVVKLSMMKHIDKILEDFPEDIGKDASSPASDHLFEVRDEEETEKLGKSLCKERAKDFHHSVAQLLFVSTRVRRDIQTVVAFLTTRVKRPDEDDWGKLKRVLKYLKGTRFMRLTLSVDSLDVIRWYVDASYNVHWDCKGQTGAMMTLGRGAPISFSRKQKLNVRSSTEGELVGIDDALPIILWGRYFIESLGYTVEQVILYQDNKSTILLANNGRWSASKRTKHIKSRYFFIKDKVDSGEITIEHKPTEEMFSDVLTKPKQGKGFRQDRAMLMNCEEDYDDEKERLKMHPKLTPAVEGPVDPKTIATTIPAQNQDLARDRRSVLEDSKKARKTVTWNTSSNRVDKYNEKAQQRHLELVVARAMRRRALLMARPSGLE